MFKNKKNIYISILFILFLSLIPLGCDEEGTSDGGPAVTNKTGYVYGPVKPEKTEDGLAIGLIALDQNLPPEGYEAIPNAVVSIGDIRVKSDDKGLFKITGVSPGEHQMLVNAQGFQPVVQMSAVSSASSTTIAIDTIKIIPQQGVVLKDKLIQFVAVGKEPAGNFVPLSSVTWSILSSDKKEKGKISNTGVFTPIEPGEVKIIASSGTYNSNTELIILDPASASTSTLTGKVNLSSGSPVENATVLVSGTNLLGTTDEKGRYSVLSVPSDVPLTLFIVKNDKIIGSAPVTLEKWKEKSLDLVASTDPPLIADEPNSVVSKTPSTEIFSISGKVFIPSKENKEKDKPVEGLTLVQAKTALKDYMAVSGAKVMLESNPEINAITSSNGNFTLDNIPFKDNSSYFVVVKLDGYIPVRVAVTVDGKYPEGIATSMDISPLDPFILLGNSVEFKPFFFDRKKQLLKTLNVNWSSEGDVGQIDPLTGLFTPTRVGKGTVVAVYGDIIERNNFTVINKEEVGSLSGTVKDKEEKPISEAFVIVKNSPWVGITDESGKYNIPIVPQGEKVSVNVLYNGQECGNSIAGISKGRDNTKDILVKTLLKENIAENTGKNNIPDKPPSSVNPYNSDINKNIGNSPEKVTLPEDGKKIKSRLEFPRWPTLNEKENSSKDPNTEKIEEEVNKASSSSSNFPRWPVKVN